MNHPRSTSAACFEVTSNWSSRAVVYDTFTDICGHRTLKAPHPVRSAQLSKVSPSQYCGGGPRGNPRCCSSIFFSTGSSCYTAVEVMDGLAHASIEGGTTNFLNETEQQAHLA